MRLHSFQIKNYKSIVDTGEITLSSFDNIMVLAGQNESGKSSILEALRDYEEGEYNPDSLPFSTKEASPQNVSCTYSIEKDDDLMAILTNEFAEKYKLEPLEGEVNIFDSRKLKSLGSFTLTRFVVDGKSSLSVNKSAFEIIKASLLETDRLIEETTEDGKKGLKQKWVDLSDNDNSTVAKILWQITPKIILFNDFCDLLPDRITLAELKDKNKEVKGYRAVKNLEKILEVDFTDLCSKKDLERLAIHEEHNKFLSVDFQKSWGQKIHNDNKVEVKYDFQKRDVDNKSYINFYIETKDRQKIKPRLRSKGLVWFLSFWLELKAQNASDHQLIILVDEPGLFLHIKAQADILMLFKKFAEQGHQIIYTTHSPSLIETKHLNRISLVLNDKDEGTVLEPLTTAKINSENKKDALQPIAYAIGLEVNDFSEFGRKNVILEGLSDFYYFLAMKKLLKHKSDYNFLPGIGIRKIESLISLCIGHGFDWLVIMDDDRKKGGKDSKTKFNEISDHVFDGDEEKTKEKAFVLQGIVGIENMFTIDDLKLIDTNINKKKNLSESVGKNRKILFARQFFERVEAGKIKIGSLSKIAKDNFTRVFQWIDEH